MVDVVEELVIRDCCFANSQSVCVKRVGCMVSIFERFCRKEDPRAGVFRIRIRVRVRVDSR